MAPKNYTNITTNTNTNNTTTYTCLLYYTTWLVQYYFKKIPGPGFGVRPGSQPGNPQEGFLRRDTIILPYFSPSHTGGMRGPLKGLFQSYTERTRSSTTSC
jgi:hypothetical protein